MTHTDMFEIIPELEALEIHFRQPITGSARDRWLIDWTRDLAGFSIEDIRKGCKHWRMNGEKFPRSGQLIGAIKNATRMDGAVSSQAWAPVALDEFEALDLPEKIRQHRILAAEAYRKAGPMYRNTSGVGGLRAASGAHLTPDEMPDEWHHWTRVAREHEAEVERFTALLKGRAPRFALPALPASLLPSMTPAEIATRLREMADAQEAADEVVL